MTLTGAEWPTPTPTRRPMPERPLAALPRRDPLAPAAGDLVPVPTSRRRPRSHARRRAQARRARAALRAHAADIGLVVLAVVCVLLVVLTLRG